MPARDIVSGYKIQSNKKNKKGEKMEPSKVAAIEKLNKVLENIEYQLLELAREYEQEIKAENPDDYELDLIFKFCAGEEEIASWFKSMKIHLENFKKMELEVKTISEMKARLLEVQKKLLEVGKSIR